MRNNIISFMIGFVTGVVILSLLLINSAHACSPNVQKLNKGEIMPCTGWAVSEPTMQEIAREKKELEIVKKENITLKQLGIVNDEVIDFHKQRANGLQKELRKEEVKSNLKMVGGFLLGVLATGLAAHAAIKASK